jgi:hypothetical protein
MRLILVASETGNLGSGWEKYHEIWPALERKERQVNLRSISEGAGMLLYWAGVRNEELEVEA